jgi:hypothetical protein
VTGRREGRRKQLLGDLKETSGYWKFEREAVDGALWRSRSGRGYGPAIRLGIAEYINIQKAGWLHSHSNTCLLSPDA